MRQKLQAIRIWFARRLLKGTGLITVSVAEVERVGVLCDELQEYAVHSGALNSPHRTKARKYIGKLTDELASTATGFKPQDQAPPEE